MKILHVSPCSPYNIGWGYQENLLPKYHAKLGHRVKLITTVYEHGKDSIKEVSEGEWELPSGEQLIRKKHKFILNRKLTVFFSVMDMYGILKKYMPDYIFFHGMVSASIILIAHYKKHINPDCIIVQDNHLDYNIGNIHSNFIKRHLLKFYYASLHFITKKYISKVYGVTPWRKKYAEIEYSVSPSMTDVLIMGADDDKVNLSQKKEIKTRIREKYHINDDDFLIVTGGKIDKKKKILELMQAVNQLEANSVKLLIFGNVNDDCVQSFNKELSDRIVYVGWISADSVYQYFHAADLVAFPGQHSVLWEQACASKVPCIFANWEGMHHVNNGGNSCFFGATSVDAIRKALSSLIGTEKYNQIKTVAESSVTDVYLYSEIAKASLTNFHFKHEN